ncbi:hypothetical protein AJ79_07969 [Helicocarpus griseus UAMH5409]|uniref:Ubiquinone/menaquinone biosynthesis methyltransferase n=1 Tax=Helicocarpus griseus UAMH5409 TaxID=1447875 RepID=A0A2B7WXD2_9EURO|nr:hypothetical protein AJ79_07969 [Helicocarpus griseus UAMH5409]
MASQGAKRLPKAAGLKGPSALRTKPRPKQIPAAPLSRTSPNNPSHCQYSPTQPPPPPSPPRPWSVNPKALTAWTIAAFVFSTYGTYLYVSYDKTVKNSKSLSVPDDVADRYDKTATNFDAEVNMAEQVMSMGTKRRELVQRARGNVLEVACGTGRNMKYYSLGEKRGTNKDGKAEIQGCRSVTFVDLSGRMVQIAKDKFEQLYPEFRMAAFRTQDAMDPIPPPPNTAAIQPGPLTSEPQKYQFDTVIQTMGLCSHPNPVAYLTHLGTLVKPERGEILLLEHGRSHYKWLNKVLDDLAPAHADRHGCWWNRDIGEIVRESGLEVVESKRWHMGTTWKFVLRPKVPGAETEEGHENGKGGKNSTWLSWFGL